MRTRKEQKRKEERITFNINERVVEVDGHDEEGWGLVGGGWRLGAFLKGSRGEGSTILPAMKKAILCHILNFSHPFTFLRKFNSS